jgi:hypothetical protein
MAGSFGDLRVLTSGLDSFAASTAGDKHFVPPSMDEESSTAVDEKPRLRFGRMFPDLEPFRPACPEIRRK